MGLTYKDAGVDIEAGDALVERIKPFAARTLRPEVVSGVGGFGGLFAVPPGRFREPVLVSGTDGVGTKLKIAIAAGRHDTVGIDIVHHCANDILAQGARPLFFLDYIAMSRLVPATVEQLLQGLATACRGLECALLGGETAELPDFYPPEDYDLVGFIVGAAVVGFVDLLRAGPVGQAERQRAVVLGEEGKLPLRLRWGHAVGTVKRHHLNLPGRRGAAWRRRPRRRGGNPASACRWPGPAPRPRWPGPASWPIPGAAWSW